MIEYFKQGFSQRASIIIRLFILTLIGGSLTYLIWIGKNSLEQIQPLIENIQYIHLIYAIIWYLLSLSASLLLWFFIIRTLDTKVGWWKNVQIYCITFAARRLPGTIWHVGGRILLYQRLGVLKSSVLFASLVEFVIGYVAAGIVGLFLFSLIGIKLSSSLIVVVIFLIMGGSVLVIPKFIRNFKRKIGYFSPIYAKTGDWIIWIISAIAMWIFGGMMLVQLTKMLRPDLNIRDTIYVLAAWAMSGLAGLLTYFLPSSFGATEISLSFFLTQLLPLPLAGAVAIATRLFTLTMDMILSFMTYVLIVRHLPLFRSLALEDFHMPNNKPSSDETHSEFLGEISDDRNSASKHH